MWADIAEQNRKYHKEYRKHKKATQPNYFAEKVRQCRYGLSPEDYNTRLSAQKGLCALCGSRGKKRLAVDHNHKTGKFRELLCARCNIGLGYFKDDPNLLLAAHDYLMRHQDK